MVRIKKLGELKSERERKRLQAKLEKVEEVIAPPVSEEGKTIENDVDANFQRLKKLLGESNDLITRRITIPAHPDVVIGLAYMDGLVNCEVIERFIMNAMAHHLEEDLNKTASDPYRTIVEYSLAVGEISEETQFDKALLHILSGDTVVFVQGCKTCITTNTRGWQQRSITDPQSQTVVRGPRDSFTETLRTNTALVRRRIKSSNLWCEVQQVGEVTKTDVALMYIKGIVDEKIIEEVKERIDKIDIDGILESGYIEELIQDEDYTPFPTIFNTERPDVVAACLLEGRVAIIVDGTPFVLLVPSLFIQYFQSAEDYYQRADIATLIRLIRYISFFLALLTPSAYIALTTMHQEMLPFPLLVSIAAQREGVPFPALVEAFIMEITFEILREAGIRMPRNVSSAISIVGALVLGEAAVQAGLVSPAMIIVVAITAISNFVSPAYDMAIAVRMLRFILMMLSAAFGFFGIIIGLIFMILHLCSIRSFGINYMAPMAPFDRKGQKDSLIRRSLKKMTTRPSLASEENIVRQHQPSENTNK
ncbi:spore germination protein [Priestia koreensis]|uniref:spore germination protein n=2 Tax=Priestia koreensis TaxID=284581 RepID=UPI001F597375|nr:spore germination protein [Priestia koreensis]